MRTRWKYLLIFLAITIILASFLFLQNSPKKKFEDANRFYTQGISAVDKGDYDTAIDKFNKVIKLTPLNVDAWYNRGTIYLSMDEYDKAAEDFNKALELNPSNIKIYINLAAVYSRKGQHEKGIQILSDCIEKNKTGGAMLLSICYSNRGLRYALTNQLEKANEDYNSALGLYPDNPVAYFNLANLYQKQGNNIKALKFYKASIEKFNDTDITDEFCKVSPSSREYFKNLLREAQKSTKDIKEKMRVK